MALFILSPSVLGMGNALLIPRVVNTKEPRPRIGNVKRKNEFMD
jgi:hypothetical protein